ncbi:MAG: GNAT family N-acetyltransferase [bacterium]|nr:GNAT family N-acetyltransferase [bacterium]
MRKYRRENIRSNTGKKLIRSLFQAVDWYSGNFPERLKKAFENSSHVISAWDGEQLIGLIRGLDDGIWQATIDCLLVKPEYQGQQIASTLLHMLLEEYKELLYVDVVPEEKRNVGFYLKHGFKIMEEGTPLQIKGDWE